MYWASWAYGLLARCRYAPFLRLRPGAGRWRERVGGALALLARWKADGRAGCERAPQRRERMPGNSLPDAKRSLTMWNEVAVCVVDCRQAETPGMQYFTDESCPAGWRSSLQPSEVRAQARRHRGALIPPVARGSIRLRAGSMRQLPHFNKGNFVINQWVVLYLSKNEHIRI